MSPGTKTRSSGATTPKKGRSTPSRPRSGPGGGRPPTKPPDGPKLSEVARHIVRPAGIVGTAWPRVRDTCRNIGWTFDRWQDGLGRLILALDGTGLYASDTSVISIPRQVGKTYLVGCIVFTLALLTPGLTVIWTAHRTKTAKETFGSMKAMCAKPLVAAHIEKISDGRGDEGIYLKNGSRILFGARENGFGLGFAGVGILVLDEAQRLTSKAMDDLIPTMNTVENPLILMTGTPPRPTDNGEVFTMQRQEALDADAEGRPTDGSLYVEFSADEGADPDDRDQLRKANPSYPHRTGERAIRRMRKNLTEESFLREALGIWDKMAHRPIVTATRWKRLERSGPVGGTKPDGFGVDMSHARMISVNACWLDGDDAHGEEVWAGDDTAAAVEWIADAWRRAGRRTVVVIDSESPAASLVVDLENAGVNVHVTTASQMAAACGAVENRLKAGTLTHGGQMSITDAVVKNGKRRSIRGAGGWGWDRRNPSSQIQQAVAMTLALFGATKNKRAARKRSTETAGREAVVL